MITLRDWVEVLNPADDAEDDHGNPIDTWAGTPLREPAQVSPAGGGAGSSSENIVGGDVVTSRMRLTLAGVTSAASSSRILWNGDTYEVEGDVMPVPGRGGRIHHHAAIIRKVEG